jgi:hypothetical protein
MGQDALKQGGSYSKITNMHVLSKIGRMKYIKESDFKKEFETINNEMKEEYQELLRGDDFYA